MPQKFRSVSYPVFFKLFCEFACDADAMVGKKTGGGFQGFEKTVGRLKEDCSALPGNSLSQRVFALPAFDR